MKGYFVAEGYMGYVENGYQLFADERDYREYFEETNENSHYSVYNHSVIQ